MKSPVAIVKVGGAILEDPSRKHHFLKAFLSLPAPKILIHGGGILANQLAEKLSIPVTMIEGRRVTDSATLDIVTMVYGGKISKGLAAYLSSHTCPAIGLTGADMMLVESKKRSSQPVDYGFVGDVISVNYKALFQLLEAGICPIIAPLSCDAQGQILNTNADTMAAAITESLSLNHHQVILYLTMDLDGVRTSLNEPESLLPQIDQQQYLQLKEAGIISGGMIPKLYNCFAAKKAGASRVFICTPEALGARNGMEPLPATEIL